MSVPASAFSNQAKVIPITLGGMGANGVTIIVGVILAADFRLRRALALA